MQNKAIGIFDSGVGGLSVVREIIKTLPSESIIYLGDAARVPYGTRNKALIKKFSLELAHFLLKKDIKLLVVACNTISSTCLKDIEKISPVGTIGVVKPACQAIVATTLNKRVGIIGTRATIRSKVYEKEINKIDPTIKLISKSTPLLVSVVEEGLSNSRLAKSVVEYYLSGYKNIDTLHLGCTHFPILKKLIQEVLEKSVKVIDSARPTANEIKSLLLQSDLLSTSTSPTRKFYFTEITENTIKTANKLIGEDISEDVFEIKI